MAEISSLLQKYLSLVSDCVKFFTVVEIAETQYDCNSVEQLRRLHGRKYFRYYKETTNFYVGAVSVADNSG
jgi:RecB family endonuclease NucS